jgi:hypothetical protein
MLSTASIVLSLLILGLTISGATRDQSSIWSLLEMVLVGLLPLTIGSVLFLERQARGTSGANLSAQHPRT